ALARPRPRREADRPRHLGRGGAHRLSGGLPPAPGPPARSRGALRADPRARHRRRGGRAPAAHGRPPRPRGRGRRALRARARRRGREPGRAARRAPDGGGRRAGARRDRPPRRAAQGPRRGRRDRSDAAALDLARAAAQRRSARGRRVSAPPATAPPRPRRRLWLRALGALGALGAVVAAAVTWAVIRALGPAAEVAAPVRYAVAPGATLRRVAEDLEALGVIRSALALRGLARWQGTEGRLHAGEYELSPTWDAARVLEQMVAGRVITYPVTLPEGITAAEIAARIEQAGLVPAAELLAVVRDPASPAAFGVEGTTLEGYLFPETYHLPRGLPARQIAKVMVDQFLRV